MPSDLATANVAFFISDNYRHCCRALDNLTPADVLKGRREEPCGGVRTCRLRLSMAEDATTGPSRRRHTSK